MSVGNRERPNTDAREAGEAFLKAAQILDVVEVNVPHQRWPGRRRAEAEALAYRLICWDEFLRVCQRRQPFLHMAPAPSRMAATAAVMHAAEGLEPRWEHGTVGQGRSQQSGQRP